MKSYCLTCQRPTNQEVVKDVSQSYVEDGTGWWEDKNYQIIQCKGCDTVSFRLLYNDASLQQYEVEDASRQELYPKRHANSRSVKDYKGVSGKLIKIYNETIEAYNADMKLLASIGIRAILEGICKDKKVEKGTYTNIKNKVVTSKDLVGKIYGLAEEGHLTTTQADLLHELRFLGNSAVHDLVTPEPMELRMAIDIVEHVLENLYDIPYKGRRLKVKRTTI